MDADWFKSRAKVPLEEILRRAGLPLADREGLTPLDAEVDVNKNDAMVSQEWGQAVRLECLKLAAANGYSATEKMIDAARCLADFVMNTNDAEVIRAVHEMAEKIRGAS